MPHPLTRRRLLCCGALAAAGLFTALEAPAQPRVDPRLQDWIHDSLHGLDATQLWDSHCHLLGTGDSGSGCTLHPSLDQWWHPLEYGRKRAILHGAGVAPGSPDVDRSFVQQLVTLTHDFPPGARWLLFAFEQAHDARGRALPEASTFHVPNAYAAQVAAQHPERFGWVASIHPYRPDALAALAQAAAQGAKAVKWLPASMGMDPADRRCRPFYDALVQHGLPLIVHCGDEHAVPGLGLQALGNPLRLRVALEAGVTVIVAHCASLGQAPDWDRRSAPPRPAFELFARLMDEGHERLLGDLSAVAQFNRSPEVLRTLIRREDWHGRLLHGSDHPLPGLAPMVQLGALARAGLIDAAERPGLTSLRRHNPLLFDLVLKRRLRWQGQALAASAFATARHFAVSPRDTAGLSTRHPGQRL
ncbi:amidohydrolase family protein [Inhella gelatinilytica]|uniref:Amidohydrolase family protein n=1 Tax=Inhella gelatinilytica TaxID=2795030 RepID=A0A931IXH3_9BURK|nr:amidohydrolase family protein [Inhella gelatinilytica]MBH9551813.1 amidohydrolase family protein [Inhella gelatinilytica]